MKNLLEFALLSMFLYSCGPAVESKKEEPKIPVYEMDLKIDQATDNGISFIPIHHFTPIGFNDNDSVNMATVLMVKKIMHKFKADNPDINITNWKIEAYDKDYHNIHGIWIDWEQNNIIQPSIPTIDPVSTY